MAKADLKTTATTASVADYIASLPDDHRRAEAAVIDALHRRVTGCEPRMWGPSIIGYGSYDYTYDSGCSGTMCRAGFSPRKAALVFYLVGGFGAHQTEADALFAGLGKHTTGKACLYVKRLGDVDLAVLERLVGLSWAVMNAEYPG